MTVQSMTGFARAAAERDGRHAAWEIRSVNGKGLDLRLRLPPGLDRIEPGARALVAKRFRRGTIQAALSVTKQAAARPIVDEALLQGLATLALRLTEDFGAAKARADGLLALPGVIQFGEAAESGEAQENGDRHLLALLGDAVADLETARLREGEAIAAILLGQVDAVAALTARVEADPSRQPAAIRERLEGQVRLLAGQIGLDEGRLHAEAVLLAARADIREEIDRLKTHCEAARALIAAGGAVGRRLDFLAQEFNREANTLCSKSNAAAVTSFGLELKAVVDQFREQVQNLE